MNWRRYATQAAVRRIVYVLVGLLFAALAGGVNQLGWAATACEVATQKETSQ